MNVFELKPTQMKLAQEIHQAIKDNGETIRVYVPPRFGTTTLIDTCARLWNYGNITMPTVVRPRTMQNGTPPSSSVPYVYEGQSLRGTPPKLIIIDCLEELLMAADREGKSRMPNMGFSTPTVEWLNAVLFPHKAPGGKIVHFIRYPKKDDMICEIPGIREIDRLRMLTNLYADIPGDLMMGEEDN